MASKIDRPTKTFWRISLSAAALGGWLALLSLLNSPSETGNAIFLGYSLERLVLALPLLVAGILFFFLSLRAWSSDSWLHAINSQFDKFLKKSPRFWILVSATSVLIIVSWVTAFLPQERAAFFIGPYSLYLTRLAPLALYVVLLSALITFHTLFSKYDFDLKPLRPAVGIWRLAAIVFIALIALWSLIALTGLGLGFDATMWNAPGTPILASQVFICLAAGILILSAVFYIRARYTKNSSHLQLDLALAALVWVVASILWLRQPAAPTYYSSEPRPPNYESYPLSDAFNHDVIANNVLIGEGFRFGGSVVIRRPIYVQFLAGLEALFGTNINRVVAAQVVVLALFPALLYLQAAWIHNRLSGVLLAGLVTLREVNAIALGDVVNTSHSKLLMADMPTALAMAAFGLAAIAWLRGSARNLVLPLLVGGLLGWFVLLRSQVLTLIPFFVLLAVLVWGLRAAWKPALFFVLGAVLVASPWILRNRTLTGQWAIEDAVVAGFIATRYSFEPGTFALPFLPGETEGEYYARHMQSVSDFTRQNPGYVAGFVTDNYVRNLLLTVMPLPVSLQMRDLESHVRQLPYWPSWDGSLATETLLPLVANLALIALGIAGAWRQFRWVGLVPLIINLAFTLNLALARVSGWRYNLPVDWTVIFYYVLGLSQIVIWLLLVLSQNKNIRTFAANLISPAPKIVSSRKRTSYFPLKQFALALGVLLLFGNSFLIIESFSTPRYHQLTREEAVAMLSNASSDEEVLTADLGAMVTNGSLQYLNGRALYPSFYRAGEGNVEREFALISPMDFDRITFYLVGPDAASVALRVNDPDIYFPSGSEVLILYCGDTLDAAAVVVQDDRSAHLLLSADLQASCPQLVQ